MCDRIYLMKLAVNVCEIPLYKTPFDESWSDDIIGLIEEGDIVIELFKTNGEKFCLTKLGVGFTSAIEDLFEYFDEKI